MIIVTRDNQRIGVPQPAHAVLSGILADAWHPASLPAALPIADIVLAAAQHDIGWLPWEAAPTRDPATGLPWDFRARPAEDHPPMWAEGVRLAIAAYGPLVGWLVSRHGTRVVRRGPDGEPTSPLAAAYIATEEALQSDLAARGRFDPVAAERASELVAAVDFLSLRICFGAGGPIPGAPLGTGHATLALAGGPTAFTLAPWPFLTPEIVAGVSAVVLPEIGYPTQDAMREALSRAPWQRLPVRITPGG